MSNITIKKVILNDELFAKVWFDRHKPNNIVEKVPGQDSTGAVHEDMVAAFKKLDPHLAFICQQITEEDFIRAIADKPKADEQPVRKVGKLKSVNLFNEEDREPLPEEAFEVTRFEIVGSGDNEGCILTGTRLLDTKEFMGFSSPPVKWSGTYKYASELAQAIEVCKYEVLEFLVNDKMAPDRQLDLEFDVKEPADQNEEL